MVAYNLDGIAKATSSHFDLGFEPENLLNDEGTWKVSNNFGNELSAWIHIKLPRPMVMNGLEI